MSEDSSRLARWLGAIGLLALTGFVAAFVNIPWDWSMFMDDTQYNTWMPQVKDLREAFAHEVQAYWGLGRFYPVKYVANLLKWRYLPNDPFVFRCFNFGVFLLATLFGGLAAIRANRPRLAPLGGLGAASLAAFFVGSALLHKPILEIISLNPLGETWVCLFFGLGSFFFLRCRFVWKQVVARACFALVALSKEPAALVFLASAAHYAFLAWREPSCRRKWGANAALDFVVFLVFLGLALNLKSHSTFIQNAYFGHVGVLNYAHDLVYKLARYALWTSPFLAAFFLCRRELATLLRDRDLAAAALFFGTFALGYEVFMSTQGIVAYQETPASFGWFCLYSLLTAALLGSGALARNVPRHGVLLAAMFCLSYFVSVSRWERFVRGMVEPRKAVTQVIHSQSAFTLFVPVGEIYGHLEILMKDAPAGSRLFQVDERLAEAEPQLRGRVFAFEFPTYMGDLPQERLAQLERLAGGWASVTDAKSYRLYVGRKVFGEKP